MRRVLLIVWLFASVVLLNSGLAVAADAVRLVDPAAFPKARQPQAAVDPSGAIHVVFGAGDGFHVTTSRDGGKSFGEPVKVGEMEFYALGMRRGPRIAATAKAVVVTVIGGKQGGGKDGDVLAYRSQDGGKTWQGPVLVNSAPASAREGLHHMAAAPDGTIACVWLDLREGKMQVWGAFSSDGATWKDEKRIYASPDGHVCTCCQPLVSYDPRGGLHVMWRNDLAKSRDMYVCSSTDGGKTFGDAVKLGKETWVLDRCPMDAGALAINSNGDMETIWMRKGQIYRCRPGQAEVRLGRGEQGWAAAGADGFYLVWLEARPGALRALLPGADRPTTLAHGALDPVVAAPVDGKGPVVAVWEEGVDRRGPVRLWARVLKATR
jgi:hypothetical protein